MHLIKKIYSITIQPLIAKRIYRSSFYQWKEVRLHLLPGVFHPKYFFSTKYLLKYILTQNLEHIQFLELGAGNGLISISVAKKTAKVFASDISKKVVELLKENAVANHVSISIIESDLFDAFPEIQFDMIAINPPYYPKAPRNELEMAWYCGENFEYFEKLFSQLNSFVHPKSIILMVLSEDCNINKISSIAKKNKFTLEEQHSKKFYWERNFIFKIQKL